MAHFAQLDENNIVLQVIVVHNNELLDENGAESEDKGITFCQTLFPGTTWKQTSYNNNFRVRYAGIGYSYNTQLDAFIPPKPYPSWVLSPATVDWEAPVAYPTDGKVYSWDEATQKWVLVDPQPGA
mgnify:CR=1 FL=1